VDAELETLWTPAVQVWDLVLDNADQPSSLATSVSMVVKLLKAELELEAELELLRSVRNVFLMEDWVDAFWILARPSSDLLVSYVLPSVARNPPNGVGE
jgi:hypothetical protein